MGVMVDHTHTSKESEEWGNDSMSKYSAIMPTAAGERNFFVKNIANSGAYAPHTPARGFALRQLRPFGPIVEIAS